MDIYSYTGLLNVSVKRIKEKSGMSHCVLGVVNNETNSNIILTFYLFVIMCISKFLSKTEPNKQIYICNDKNFFIQLYFTLN